MIVSLFQMNVTLSHNKSIGNDFIKEFKSEWEWAMKKYVEVWNKFYEYWVSMAQLKKLPCLFVRYEDLALDSESSMKEVMQFMLGVKSIEGTYIEKRISTNLKEMSSGQVYAPRSGKVNGNLKYFNKEQYEYVKKECRDFILFFGYAKVLGQNNPNAFFEYSDLT